MMEYLEMVLEISKVWGPTVVLGVLAFHFLDKKDQRAAEMLTAKDIRAEEAVRSIVKSHRADWVQQLQASDEHMRTMAHNYKENLAEVTRSSDARTEKLVAAINDLRIDIKLGRQNGGQS